MSRAINVQSVLIKSLRMQTLMQKINQVVWLILFIYTFFDYYKGLVNNYKKTTKNSSNIVIYLLILLLSTYLKISFSFSK